MRLSGLAALLLSGPALAIGLAAGPVRAEDADVYRRVCAECHANAAVVARRFASLAPEARRQRWEAFLQRHHGGDAEQRAALIRYLESAPAPPR
jgi:mono/diheme cytochrome c family protein